MSDNAPPTILLTRPRAQAERFADTLCTRFDDIEVIIAPLMEIVRKPPPPAALGADILVFTSENAVPAAGPGVGRPAWCVGPRTAMAARMAGFDAISVDGTVDDLVAALRNAHPQGQIWHLHGAHVRGDLGNRLRAAGLAVQDAAVYAQDALAPGAEFAAALARDTVIVPLFSPRSAALFAEAAGALAQSRAPCLITISAAARDALPTGLRSTAILAEAPNGEAMLTAIARRIGT